MDVGFGKRYKKSYEFTKFAKPIVGSRVSWK